MLYAIFSLSFAIAFTDILWFSEIKRKSKYKRLVILVLISCLSLGFIIGFQSSIKEERVVNKTFKVVCENDEYFYYVKNTSGDILKKILDPTLTTIRETEQNDTFAVEYVVYKKLRIGEEWTRFLFWDERLVFSSSKEIAYEINVPKGTINKAV